MRTAAWLLALLLTAASPRRRAATITVVNNDGAGEGFNDPRRGARRRQHRDDARRATPERVHVRREPLGGGADERGARSRSTPPSTTSPARDERRARLGRRAERVINFTNAPYTNTIYPQALANKIRGSDLDRRTTTSSRSSTARSGRAAA
jgi:hypothetical protein